MLSLLRILRSAPVSALLLTLFGSALATPASAVVLPFDGTLAVRVATLPPVSIPVSGSAVVNGSGPAGHLTSLSLPASPFATTGYVVPVTDPSAFPIMGVQATFHNAAGNFAGSGGAGFGGVMPLLGVSKVCLYGACGSSANISNLSVPLSVVGQGGVASVMGAVNVTVVGAPWTTATAAVGSLSMMGGVSPLSNTGANSGTLTLVTPILIKTGIGGFSAVPAFGILTLHFVPEPGTLVLLGTAVTGLAAWGRRTKRGNA